MLPGAWSLWCSPAQVYSPFNGPRMLIVSLGRKHGAMHVGGVVFCHLLPRVKSKGLFIAQTRKQLGLPDPGGGFACARAPAAAS